MIGLEEAQARLLALKPAVDIETCNLISAAGRWAAEPVLARRTQPAQDLSAMDGYAIRFADMPGPWRIIGESAAGTPFSERIYEGEAVRIFTGAALPVAGDTIVIQEDVARSGESLMLTGDGPSNRGNAVRAAGEDFKRDAILLAAGDKITSARLALAAIGGHETIKARRLIRVAIASTGNELGGSLPDSNGPMLAALLGDLPVRVTRFGIVRDDPADLANLFESARGFDILVTTGGASVGDHDLVRPALIAAGATIAFWKVAIRPGKPVLAARIGETIVLALPGNPVSAFVTAHLFLRPLIAQLSGAADPLPRQTAAILSAALPAVGDRTDFVRARWADGRLLPARVGDSGALSPLAEAEALIVRPMRSPPARAGDQVSIIPIA